jgi:hypothetical protein
MRLGACVSQAFPKLTWEDVPALLELAPSTAPLKNFVVNPLSSRAQLECSEGVMALWLIEGIRKGGRYPSLNPLLRPAWAVPGDAVRESEGNRPRASAAYHAWWGKVRSWPRARAAALDPLRGTGLSWY